jgi:hypothetical protein
MFKYFTHNGTRKFTDIISELVASYNNSKHSSIKAKPKDVTKVNEKEIFFNLYGVHTYRELLHKGRESKLNAGEKVRLQLPAKPFDKGYNPNWSDQIFTVEKVIKERKKPYIVISDYYGKLLDRRFYPEDLQKVTETVYRVERIIRRRKRKGKLEYFVKWLNYPNSDNAWISGENVIDIKNA